MGEDLRSKAYLRIINALDTGRLEKAVADAVATRDSDSPQNVADITEESGLDNLKAKAFSRIVEALRSGTLEQAMAEATGKATSKEEVIERLKEHVEVLTTTLAQLAQENRFLRKENTMLRSNPASAIQNPPATTGSALQLIRAPQREDQI